MFNISNYLFVWNMHIIYIIQNLPEYLEYWCDIVRRHGIIVKEETTFIAVAAILEGGGGGG